MDRIERMKQLTEQYYQSQKATIMKPADRQAREKEAAAKGVKTEKAKKEAKPKTEKAKK